MPGPAHDIPPRWLPVVEELVRLVDRGDPRAREVFDTLAAPDFYRETAFTELDKLLSDPSYSIANERSTKEKWILYTDEVLTLAVSIISQADDQVISTTCADTSFAVVGPGTIVVEHYRTTIDSDERDLLGRDHGIELQETRQLVAGTSIHLVEGIDLARFASCSQPTPVLSLNAHRSSVRLCWDYDVRTGKAISCCYADPAASQMEFLLGVIAHQDRLDQIEFVREALTHRVHAVRWAAVKALWKLDVDSAVAATRACLEDAHPHVRRAAERTLLSYQSQQGVAACR
jgi:hypothetical protein